MMDKKSLAMGVALLAGTTAASAEGLGIALNGGVVGLGIGTGVDIVYSVNPSVNIRGGVMQGKKPLMPQLMPTSSPLHQKQIPQDCLPIG